MVPDAGPVARIDLHESLWVASHHMLTATIAPAPEVAGNGDGRLARALRHSALRNAAMDAEMDARFAQMDTADICRTSADIGRTYREVPVRCPAEIPTVSASGRHAFVEADNPFTQASKHHLRQRLEFLA